MSQKFVPCTSVPRNTWKASKSYGIVLIRKTLFNEYEYLMVCRRNTFAYVDYLMGKYSENNLEFIASLVLNMTFFERKLIIEKPYEYLWKRLYVFNRQAEGEFYNIVKNKFDNQLENFIQVEKKLSELYCWQYPEWGFPKGKTNGKESNLESAQRELEEETMVSKDMYDIDFSIDPFEEEFIGTNGHKYINLFYVAFAKDNCNAFLDIKNSDQVREIGQISWVNSKYAYKKVRDYEISKKVLITEINKILKKKNN